MATCKIEKIKINATIILSLLCSIVACFLLTFGGIYFTRENYKVVNYATTMCQIKNASWKSVRYIKFYNYIDRYVATWGVFHNNFYALMQGTKQYISSSNALAEAEKYRVDSSYLCWYDRKRRTVAQWDKPNTQHGITLISFGVLLLVLCIILLFLMYRFSRQIQRRDEQNKVTRIHVTFLK